MPTKITSSLSAQPLRHYINVLGHNVLRELLKYIPQGIVQAAAREHGVDAQASSYSVWSHLAAMVFVQLAHSGPFAPLWASLRRQAQGAAACCTTSR